MGPCVHGNDHWSVLLAQAAVSDQSNVLLCSPELSVIRDEAIFR